ANAITAKVEVQGTCYISLSTNAINFGSIVPTANVPTNKIVTDSDSLGNVAASLLVGGTNWTLTSNALVTFGVSNTIWSNTIQTTYAGTALTGNLVTTGISIPPDSSTGNSIYFGLQIPGGTPAGTYVQTITIENGC
ncbi:MAG: hypothetical protein QXR73_03695, partial [Candidatus Micrarchaeaceae archaeon]